MSLPALLDLTLNLYKINITILLLTEKCHEILGKRNKKMNFRVGAL